MTSDVSEEQINPGSSDDFEDLVPQGGLMLKG